MEDSEIIRLREKGIPGGVTFLDGQSELPMLEVTTAWSTAEIYLHGAQVTQFKKNNESPLLFLSTCSRFSEGQPIRGGIPIVFPWFGPREGHPQHGFARLKDWRLRQVLPAADGSVSVRFHLRKCPEAAGLPPFAVEYVVTVADTLTLQLVVKNRSHDVDFTFENCLHTYFEVGDVNAISITGLKGAGYVDRTTGAMPKIDAQDAIRIGAEVDRTYLNTPAAVEIIDPSFHRRIRIEKEGSASTVVWNPWVEKAQQLADFGNDEFQRMVCVESGNVASDKITLAPGKTTTLRVKLSSQSLG